MAREFGEIEAIEEFIRYLEIMDDSTASERAAPPSGHSETVRVMTVHCAKGLEFDHVFVPGLSERLFPYACGAQSPLQNPESLPTPLKLNPDPEAKPPTTRSTRTVLRTRSRGKLVKKRQAILRGGDARGIQPDPKPRSLLPL